MEVELDHVFAKRSQLERVAIPEVLYFQKEACIMGNVSASPSAFLFTAQEPCGSSG
jgi:hypothetical protein